MTFPFPPSLDGVTAAAEKREEFRPFYPRRVITPPGYLNIKRVSVLFFEAFLLDGKLPHLINEKYDLSPSTRTYSNIGDELLRNQFQTFWLGRALGEDLLQTQPPLGIPYREFPWPFSAFTVMLPYGLLHRLGGDIPFISIMFVDGTLQFVAPVALPGVLKVMSGSLIPGKGEGLSDMDPSILLSDSIFSTTGQTKQDANESALLINLVTNMMFYMDSDGASIEESQREGKSKGKGDSGLWSPKWVGQRHRRDTDTIKGTHASPRTHWRRGHWRNQAIGEGRISRKRLWIKPMLINTQGESHAQVNP